MAKTSRARRRPNPAPRKPGNAVAVRPKTEVVLPTHVIPSQQPPVLVQTYGEPTAERILTSYDQYVELAYGGNVVMFGLLNTLMRLFSEARLCFRDLDDKKLTYKVAAEQLAKLFKPWPNGFTGDMLSRMIQDAGIAGNAYVRDAGSRVERLRPDWVTIVSWITEDDLGHQIREVVGYMYDPTGDPERSADWYPVEEVAHWAPIPDPLANFRGMSWFTPALREINADRAMTEHREKFWRNSAPQPLDAKILTPTGWSTMGEMRVGGQVIGLDGKAHEVIGVYPQGEQEIYRVRFTDGGETECTWDHVWSVASYYDIKRGVRRTKSLAEIVDGGLRYPSGEPKWAVPIAEPAQFEPVADLEVDPYLLGALLGDGSFRPNAHGSGGASLAAAAADADDMQGLIEALLPERVEISRRDRGGWSEFYFRRNGGPRENALTEALRGLGLFGLEGRDKFIPDHYLTADIADRIALLQGLIDTDGHVSGTTVRFNNTSERLCRQLADLVGGLGGVASVKPIQRPGCNPQWSVHVKRLPEWITPCRLSRKREAHRPNTHSSRFRYIESVEVVGSAQAQCIKVEVADSLYITDDFIVTHNTPNIVIKYQGTIKPEQKIALAESIAAKHGGPDRAGGTLVLDSGADLDIVGSKMSDAEFSEVLAQTENRMAVAAGVPALLAGLKEGLDAAAWSMYKQAIRAFADIRIRPDWRSACAALSVLVDVPDGYELWYDTRDIAALQESETESASRMQTVMTTINSGITAGFEPGSVVKAVAAGDETLLVHTGMVSVQLNKPGEEDKPEGDAPAGAAAEPEQDKPAEEPVARALIAELARSRRSLEQVLGRTMDQIERRWSPDTFDEGEVDRDRRGQFAAKAGGLLDKLKLASRIVLDAGEQLVASDRVSPADEHHGNEVLLAAIDTPSGRQLRLGVINQDDRRSWRAANRGATVQLDASAVAQLDSNLADVMDEAVRVRKEFRALAAKAGDADYSYDSRRLPDWESGSMTPAEFREFEKQGFEFGPDVTPEQRAIILQLHETSDLPLLEGVLAGGPWGELRYQLVPLTEGLDADEVDVRIDLGVQPADAPDDWEFGDLIDTDGQVEMREKDLRQLRVKLAQFSGDATRSQLHRARTKEEFARLVAARKVKRDGEGKFSRVGAVAKALLSGDLGALDAMKREPLRREAQKRGIATDGVSTQAIKDALWDHERTGVDDEADLPVGEKAELDLARMTVPQLKERAKAAKVPGYSKLRKPELVAALRPAAEPPKKNAPGSIPVSVRVSASNSDQSTWRATGFDGLAGSDREAASAVTAYLRRPGLMNKRLRFRDDPAHPLHEQTLDELLGYEPADPAKVAAATTLADKRIAAIDRLMDKSRTTSEIVTWRGLGSDGSRGLDGLSVGDSFTDAGFMSTSADRAVAEGSFATDEGALLRIRAGAGTPAISLAGLGESEVLLGRGLTMRITGESRTDKGVRLLDVEVVPKAEGVKGYSKMRKPELVAALGPKAAPMGSADSQVRDAYTRLSQRPGEWVPVADLRAELSHLDRNEVDEALKSLAVQPGVQLIPWDNRNALTKRDHDAAVRFGGQDNHALRFDPPDAAPAVPEPRAPKVADMGGDLLGSDNGVEVAQLIAAEADSLARPDNDEFLLAIAKRQGFDGKPKVVTKSEMDTLTSKDGGHQPLYRGVASTPELSATEIHEQFRTGEYFAGLNMWGHGNGSYASMKEEMAARYSDGSPGSVMRLALRPDARVVSDKELAREHEAYLGKVRGTMAEAVFADPGRYAAARGYDAIKVTSVLRKDDDHLVILNRTAAIVEQGDNPAPVAPKSGPSAAKAEKELNALRRKRDSLRLRKDRFDQTSPYRTNKEAALDDQIATAERQIRELEDQLETPEMKAQRIADERERIQRRAALFTQTAIAEPAPSSSNMAKVTADLEALRRNPVRGDREKVAAILAPLGRKELDELAKDNDWKLHGTVPERRDQLVQNFVGKRLSSDAIFATKDTRPSPEQLAAEIEVGKTRIREAYERLLRPGAQYVSLTRLREELSDLPRAQVDAALVQLQREPGNTVIPESNQKTLTDQDRAASVRIGNEDKHLISLRRSRDDDPEQIERHEPNSTGEDDASTEPQPAATSGDDTQDPQS